GPRHRLPVGRWGVACAHRTTERRPWTSSAVLPGLDRALADARYFLGTRGQEGLRTHRLVDRDRFSLRAAASRAPAAPLRGFPRELGDASHPLGHRSRHLVVTARGVVGSTPHSPDRPL